MLDLTDELLELIDILATRYGMADCADSPLIQLREKIYDRLVLRTTTPTKGTAEKLQARSREEFQRSRVALQRVREGAGD